MFSLSKFKKIDTEIQSDFFEYYNYIDRHKLSIFNRSLDGGDYIKELVKLKCLENDFDLEDSEIYSYYQASSARLLRQLDKLSLCEEDSIAILELTLDKLRNKQ